jgi:hypothetical protein
VLILKFREKFKLKGPACQRPTTAHGRVSRPAHKHGRGHAVVARSPPDTLRTALPTGRHGHVRRPLPTYSSVRPSSRSSLLSLSPPRHLAAAPSPSLYHCCSPVHRVPPSGAVCRAPPTPSCAASSSSKLGRRPDRSHRPPSTTSATKCLHMDEPLPLFPGPTTTTVSCPPSPRSSLTVDMALTTFGSHPRRQPPSPSRPLLWPRVSGEPLSSKPSNHCPTSPACPSTSFPTGCHLRLTRNRPALAPSSHGALLLCFPFGPARFWPRANSSPC